MVVTYIEGGLGNMLFQLCFSYAKAKENNTTFHTLNYRENLDIIKDKHKADIESYEKTILRNFSILLLHCCIKHKFNIFALLILKKFLMSQIVTICIKGIFNQKSILKKAKKI
jgi:hypothetical protein